MPNINIQEVDLTSPGSLNLSANVVYVPGAAKDYVPTKYKQDTPILYKTLSEFQNDWGMYPVTLEGETAEDVKYDTGYIYAAELLRYGTPVLYDCCVNVDTNTEYYFNKGNLEKIEKTNPNYNKVSKYYKPSSPKPNSYKDMCTTIENHLTSNAERYQDKGLFDFKFISNGGYISANENIALIATKRQDCVALIDHSGTAKSLIDSTGEGESFAGKQGIPSLGSEYYAIFTPYAIYEPLCVSNYKKDNSNAQREEFFPTLIELPASFGYLMALAYATNMGSQNWLAMAGASRGVIPNIVSLIEELTTADIDKLQNRDSIAINPIANIKPFGMIVWGNRTAYDNTKKGNLTASSFLNIRNLVSEIKKTVWVASRQLTFEQNSDILWINFKSLITPTLDKMVTGGGLSGYELLKRTAKQKATLEAVIRLYAIEAVEDFEIEIQLADESTAIIE